MFERRLRDIAKAKDAVLARADDVAAVSRRAEEVVAALIGIGHWVAGLPLTVLRTPV